jgi:hypothetical protein
MFDTREAAMASNDRAREFVSRSIAHMISGPPDIIAGETLVDVQA